MSRSIEISIPYTLSQHWLADLQLLYRPILGAQASLVYEFLIIAGQLSSTLDLDDLEALSGCSSSMLESSLKKLEESALVRQYVENDALCGLLVEAPKDQAAFLEDPYFSRVFFEQAGKEAIERLERLRPPRQVKGTFKPLEGNVSVQNLETSWNQKKEEELKSAVSDYHDINAYPFDWGVFFQGMQNVFPQRLRSRENMARIAHLATLYGMGELDIRPFISRHLKDRKTWIDFDAVIEELNKSRKIMETDPDDFMQSPVSFLKARQPENVDILPSEKKLLTSLAEDKHMPFEVINTLTEYCMNQKSGAFSTGYVRAMANNLLRAKINTRKDALAYLENFDSRTSLAKGKGRRGAPKKALPDWYDTIPTEKSTAESVQAAKDLRRQLLEGGSHEENET